MIPPAVENANPSNWRWDVESTPWTLDEGDWQDFNSKWYKDVNVPLVNSELSLDPLMPYDFRSILVRKSYAMTFDHVWAQAFSSKVKNGTIITGQPGTGKSLLGFYMLVRLLQLKQVVLFSTNGEDLVLFYHGKLYRSFTSMLLAVHLEFRLPTPTSLGVFIWSLFEIRSRVEPAIFFVQQPCFPVQTALLDSARYKIWAKEQMPLYAGLPLWTRDELALGLSYQTPYNGLLDALRGDSSHSSLDHYPGTHTLLEERAEKGDTESSSPEDDLEYLLDEAINHFGYSARDVYNGVFTYDNATKQHETAFGIDYNALKGAVSVPTENTSTLSHAISHKILALSPVHGAPFENVDWQVNFKSDWVARAVVRKLGEAENTKIAQYIKFFHRTPGAHQMARRFLEPFAHRAITEASTGGFWPLTKMDSNDTDPLLFTVVQGTSQVRFPKVKRNIVKFLSLTPASLTHNTYYIPEDPNFPLFDAFTIELDHSKKSAVLWVLQMTTSRLHCGSARGYQKIRTIISNLKATFEQEPPKQKSQKVDVSQTVSTPLVQVNYLLVVPKDEKDRKWNFPNGWSKNCKRHDHRGSVYCLEVPISVTGIIGNDPVWFYPKV